jgi:hypothetical protein
MSSLHISRSLPDRELYDTAIALEIITIVRDQREISTGVAYASGDVYGALYAAMGSDWNL